MLLYISVFPAHAGVFLEYAKTRRTWKSFPRSRGGVFVLELLLVDKIKPELDDPLNHIKGQCRT